MYSSFAGVTVYAKGERCPCSDWTAVYAKGERCPCSDWTAADTAATDGGSGSGYHLLVIQDYSRTRKQFPTGQYISSRPFTVGGRRWSVRYYPNGDEEASADFVSLFLYLLDDKGTAEKPVEVKFDFSFVDRAEKHKPINIVDIEPSPFSPVNSSWGRDKFIEKDALKRSVNLRGDCVAIRCDMVVVCDHAEVILPDIGQHLRRLLETEVGADVTFEVGEETFAAHRCVLAARSTVFMAQLFGPMKEGTTTGAIRVKDMEPKVFGALLSFIYTDSLPKMKTDCTKEDEEVKEEDVVWLQDLLVAADRYDLQRLKFLCEKQLSEHIGVSSVASTLALAERHHCRGLKEACFQFLRVQSPSCLQTVMECDGWEHIVTTSPSVLNQLIAKLVSWTHK